MSTDLAHRPLQSTDKTTMNETTDLNAGMRCIKYLLLSFNLIFVATGVLVIGIGSTILTIFSNFDHLLEDRFYSPATFLIVIGAIIFVVAFFGCCGAARESTCMTMSFAVMLAIIFILEISAGFAAYMLKGGLEATLYNKISHTMSTYPNCSDVASAFDYVQRSLECCGLKNKSDWEGLLTASNSTIESDGIIIPKSCSLSGFDDQVFQRGCLRTVEFVIAQSAFVLASAAISVAILQLMGVMLACTLGKAIRRQKTERERRRWEMREKLVNSYSPLDQKDFKAGPAIFMS